MCRSGLLSWASKHLTFVKWFFIRKSFDCFEVNGKYIYFHRDEDSRVNGARFWNQLAHAMAADQKKMVLNRPDVVLVNVDVSPLLMGYFVMMRIPVILRVDGIYLEKPTLSLIRKVNLARGFLLLISYFAHKLKVDPKAKTFNFFHRNAPIYLKYLLSKRVIYQSEFSASSFKFLDLKKANSIILNGAAKGKAFNSCSARSEIRLSTIFAGGKRANKRLVELVDFVDWASESQNYAIHLTIIGFDNDDLPNEFSNSILQKLENKTLFTLLPKFGWVDDNGVLGNELLRTHAFITFTFRDPCPNVVVEAQSYGVPVIALQSGGVPEIVGRGGRLVPLDDYNGSMLWSNLTSEDYPVIDRWAVLNAMVDVRDNLREFQMRARENFERYLEINVAAQKYTSAVDEIFE